MLRTKTSKLGNSIAAACALLVTMAISVSSQAALFYGEIDNIMLTVEKAELMSDDGRITFMDETHTFDLLELTDPRAIFPGYNVPAGTYSTIRLTLSKLEMIKRDEDGNIIETYEPKLPGNGKLDLVSEEDFTIGPGGSLVIQIDMDASKSIHIVIGGTGGGTTWFRPVVFVDITSDPATLPVLF